MRLISQSGMLDIPYENVALSVGCKEGMYVIYAHTAYEGMPCIFGEYATKEKTVKVLEELHNAYVGIIKGLNVEIPEGAEGRLKEIMKNGYGMLIAKENYEGDRIEFYPMNTIFQFPSDEELEVQV